jgi:hypothetical protein
VPLADCQRATYRARISGSRENEARGAGTCGLSARRQTPSGGAASTFRKSNLKGGIRPMAKKAKKAAKKAKKAKKR